jgi:type VI secretion system lysozyme-like protein
MTHAPAPALARAPLFDRLAAPQGREAASGRLLDRAGLEASIGRELLRLLNRRSAPGATAVPTVLDYGLPDWSALHPANPEDRARLARSIVRAVQVFEPRLRDARAEVAPSPRDHGALVVRLTARLALGADSWPLQFDFDFGPLGVLPQQAEGMPA